LSQDSDSVFMTSTPNNSSTPVLSPSPLQFSTFKSDLFMKNSSNANNTTSYNNSDNRNGYKKPEIKPKPLIAPKPVSARIVREEVPPIGLAVSQAQNSLLPVILPRSGSLADVLRGAKSGNSTPNSSFEEYSYESRQHVSHKTLIGHSINSFGKGFMTAAAATNSSAVTVRIILRLMIYQ
jgi:hypothetical protein